MKVDDEIVSQKNGTRLRVRPAGYEAGPDGPRILVIGAPNLGEDPRKDVDGQRDWWALAELSDVDRLGRRANGLDIKPRPRLGQRAEMSLAERLCQRFQRPPKNVARTTHLLSATGVTMSVRPVRCQL
jgi:hypothetical protein